jgi:large subunit ribosomal protein L19
MSAASVLESIDKANRRKEAALPEFRAGDSVKVWVRIREGDKTRVQAFEGVCIRRTNRGARSAFTVRKISYGVGVERIFPDNSPNIERIEVVQRGRVHQSRLFYLRDLSGKAARIKERELHTAPSAASDEGAEGEGEEAAAPSGEPKEKIKGRGKRKKKREASAAAGA